jgi:hypothetical protein
MRKCATLQTHSNVLHYYGVRASKADAVPAAAAGSGAGGMLPVKRLDVFLERSVVIEGSAPCADVTGDSRAVLLGMADGTLRTYSWHAQVTCWHRPELWCSHRECRMRAQQHWSISVQRSCLWGWQAAGGACQLSSCLAYCSSKAAWLRSSLLRTRSGSGPFSAAGPASCAAAAVRSCATCQRRAPGLHIGVRCHIPADDASQSVPHAATFSISDASMQCVVLQAAVLPQCQRLQHGRSPPRRLAGSTPMHQQGCIAPRQWGCSPCRQWRPP